MQHALGICELVAWQDPSVVHHGVLSKSFVVVKTGLTPQQLCLKNKSTQTKNSVWIQSKRFKEIV